jgi:hypothetical protein
MYGVAVQRGYLGSLTDYYPSWLDNLADDVTIEGSAMDGAAQGPEAVRAILVAIRTLYSDGTTSRGSITLR